MAASAALTISDIPFSGPVASVQVARVDGKLIANPTTEELEKADLEMILAGSKAAVLMVEGGAKFISERDMLTAIKFGHEAIQPSIQAQESLRKKVGKEKRQFVPVEMDQAFRTEAEKFLTPKIRAALGIKDKMKRYAVRRNPEEETHG